MSEMVREGLQNYLGKNIKLTGTISAIGMLKSERPYNNDPFGFTLCIKNIKGISDIVNNRHFKKKIGYIDHLWIRLNLTNNQQFKKGQRVQLSGLVKEYKKNFVGEENKDYEVDVEYIKIIKS